MINMITCTELEKSYQKKQVVDKLSFQVKQGEVFALLGSNGAGKTTTIKMILGLVKMDGGRVELAEDLRIGYSPETPYFPPFLTGAEVLAYYAGVQRLSKEEVQASVERLIPLVGLTASKTKVKNYSKGMLQRLALAQALLGEPELLILDEPTAGIDALGRLEILELIGKMKAQGKTIILNSHILNDIERVCDRGIIMNQGRMVQQWSKEELADGNTLENFFVQAVGGAR